MNKIAMLFPGQGSQSVNMLSEMAKQFPTQIETVFSAAQQCLGYDLWQLITEDSESRLGQTEYTQPALLASSIALWNIWKTQGGHSPEFLAGHSLGEYSALVAANAIRFEDAITLVATRGRLMQEAVQEGRGGMAAIIGLPDETVKELCLSTQQGQILSPANFNAIGQVVVAGESAAIDRVIQLAEEKGALMAKKISISVPSHCGLMRPAALKLQAILDTITIHPPKVPVLFNVDVQIHTTPESIRNALVQQLYSPVRWVETIQQLHTLEVDTLVECGPGKVLSGLNKRINRQLQSFPIGTPDLLYQALEKIPAPSLVDQ